MSFLISVWYMIHNCVSTSWTTWWKKTEMPRVYTGMNEGHSRMLPNHQEWSETALMPGSGVRQAHPLPMACEMSHKHTHSPGRFINVACNSKCKPDQVLITHFELRWVYWKFNQSAVKSFKLIPTGDRYLSSPMKATHYDRLLNQVIGTVTSNHCGFISNYNLIF